MGRYEVQILDSYGLEGRDNECGGIYSVGSPFVNMCAPPTQWQTYDIIFHRPQFEDGEVVKRATFTVIHNGVLLHHHRKILGGTTHKKAPKYKKHKPKGPIQLQDHGNPIRYRNIRIRELKGYDRK